MVNQKVGDCVPSGKAKSTEKISRSLQSCLKGLLYVISFFIVSFSRVLVVCNERKRHRFWNHQVLRIQKEMPDMSKEPGCLSGVDFVGYLLKIHLYLVWQSHCVMKTLHLQFELDLPLGISWMQSRNMDTISTPSQGYCPEGGCCTERLSDSNSDPHLDSPFSSLLNFVGGQGAL